VDSRLLVVAAIFSVVRGTISKMIERAVLGVKWTAVEWCGVDKWEWIVGKGVVGLHSLRVVSSLSLRVAWRAGCF
jgi:hypothetical protein